MPWCYVVFLHSVLLSTSRQWYINWQDSYWLVLPLVCFSISNSRIDFNVYIDFYWNAIFFNWDFIILQNKITFYIFASLTQFQPLKNFNFIDLSLYVNDFQYERVAECKVSNKNWFFYSNYFFEVWFICIVIHSLFSTWLLFFVFSFDWLEYVFFFHWFNVLSEGLRQFTSILKILHLLQFWATSHQRKWTLAAFFLLIFTWWEFGFFFLWFNG